MCGKSICLDASSEGLQSLRRRFPNAYYASSLVVSRSARAELLQREIAGLNGASLLAGGSRPADDVYIIKLVATDSMSLRKAMSKVRTLVYSHWESPEPIAAEVVAPVSSPAARKSPLGDGEHRRYKNAEHRRDFFSPQR